MKVTFVDNEQCKFYRKSMATGLSFVIIFTQVLFAHLPATANNREKSLWEERQRTARQNNSNLNSHEKYAALFRSQSVIPACPPSSMAGKPGIQPFSNTLLKKVYNLDPSFYQGDGLRNGVESNLLSTLSQNATIHQIRFSKTQNKETKNIVYIQDVHGNFEAQENIGQTILKILDLDPAAAIGLEGSAGRIPIEKFRFSTNQVNKEVGSFFLKNEVITGAEYAGFSSKEIPNMFGVEDKELYLAHVTVVKEALSQQKQELEKMGKTKAQLEIQKKTVYSQELLALDEKWRNYNEGKLGLGEYIKGALKTSLSTHHQELSTFIEAYDLEKSINFSKAERERSYFLENLVGKLSKQEIDQLIHQSLALKAGQIRYPDYYQSLQNVAKKTGVFLSRTPEFQKYIQYVLTSDAIQPEKLFSEIADLEKKVWAQLCQTSEQKELCHASQLLALKEKLVGLRLTPMEWKEYKEFIKPLTLTLSPRERGYDRSPLMRQENVSTFSQNSVFPLPRGEGQGEGHFLPFEKFYELAEARNEKMVNNLLKAVPSKDKKTVVVNQKPETRSQELGTVILVAGGFHSQGISEILSKENVNLVIVTPKLTQSGTDQDNSYLSIFTQEKTPLEKIFEAPTISLVRTLKTNPIPEAGVLPFNREVVRNLALFMEKRWIDKEGKATSAHPWAKVGTRIQDDAEILSATKREWWFGAVAMVVPAVSLVFATITQSEISVLNFVIMSFFSVVFTGMITLFPHLKSHSSKGLVKLFFVSSPIVNITALLAFWGVYGGSQHIGFAAAAGFLIYNAAHFSWNWLTIQFPQLGLAPLVVNQDRLMDLAKSELLPFLKKSFLNGYIDKKEWNSVKGKLGGFVRKIPEQLTAAAESAVENSTKPLVRKRYALLSFVEELNAWLAPNGVIVQVASSKGSNPHNPQIQILPIQIDKLAYFNVTDFNKKIGMHDIAGIAVFQGGESAVANKLIGIIVSSLGARDNFPKALENIKRIYEYLETIKDDSSAFENNLLKHGTLWFEKNFGTHVPLDQLVESKLEFETFHELAHMVFRYIGDFVYEGGSEALKLYFDSFLESQLSNTQVIPSVDFIINPDSELEKAYRDESNSKAYPNLTTKEFQFEMAKSVDEVFGYLNGAVQSEQPSKQIGSFFFYYFVSLHNNSEVPKHFGFILYLLSRKLRVGLDIPLVDFYDSKKVVPALLATSRSLYELTEDELRSVFQEVVNENFTLKLVFNDKSIQVLLNTGERFVPLSEGLNNPVVDGIWSLIEKDLPYAAQFLSKAFIAKWYLIEKYSPEYTRNNIDAFLSSLYIADKLESDGESARGIAIAIHNRIKDAAIAVDVNSTTMNPSVPKEAPGQPAKEPNSPADQADFLYVNMRGTMMKASPGKSLFNDQKLESMKENFPDGEPLKTDIYSFAAEIAEGNPQLTALLEKIVDEWILITGLNQDNKEFYKVDPKTYHVSVNVAQNIAEGGSGFDAQDKKLSDEELKNILTTAKKILSETKSFGLVPQGIRAGEDGSLVLVLDWSPELHVLRTNLSEQGKANAPNKYKGTAASPFVIVTLFRSLSQVTPNEEQVKAIKAFDKKYANLSRVFKDAGVPDQIKVETLHFSNETQWMHAEKGEVNVPIKLGELTLTLDPETAAIIPDQVRKRWDSRFGEGKMKAPADIHSLGQAGWFQTLPFDPGNLPDSIEKINLHPIPLSAVMPLTSPLFASRIIPNQSLLTVIINERKYWILTDNAPTLLHESLLIPQDQELHLRLDNETANLDLLTFHNMTGLRGYINSWGLGTLPRLHDHIYFNPLPIDELQTNVKGSIDDKVEFGILKNYLGTSTVFQGEDMAALSTAMTAQAKYLLEQGIPHHVFISKGRVIFLWRNTNAQDVWDVGQNELEGRLISAFLFGGLVNYPSVTIERKTERPLNDILKRLSWPSSERDSYIRGMSSQEDDSISALGSGGFWIDRPAYKRNASWIETIVARLAIPTIIFLASFYRYDLGFLLSLILSAFVGAVIFWGLHILRGFSFDNKTFSFRKAWEAMTGFDVLWLTLLTFFAILFPLLIIPLTFYHDSIDNPVGSVPTQAFSAGLDQSKPIARIVIAADVDGTLRDDEHKNVDPEIMEELINLDKTGRVRFAAISGSAVGGIETDDWRRDNLAIGPAFNNEMEGYSPQYIDLYGSMGGQNIHGNSGTAQLLDMYTPEQAFEAIHVILKAYLEEVRDSQFSDPKNKKLVLPLLELLENIQFPSHVKTSFDLPLSLSDFQVIMESVTDPFKEIMLKIRDGGINPGARLIWRGTDVEFYAPVRDIDLNNLAVRFNFDNSVLLKALPESERSVLSGKVFAKVSKTTKKERTRLFLTEQGQSAEGQVLYVTIGDTHGDFPMHEVSLKGHLGFHVGESQIVESYPKGNLIFIRRQSGAGESHVQGTLQVLRALRQGLTEGRKFGDYEIYSRQGKDSKWQLFSGHQITTKTLDPRIAVTKKSDEDSINISNEEIAKFIAALVGPLQDQLIAKGFDFDATGRMLRSRLKSQVEYYRVGVDSQANKKDLEKLLLNLTYLGGRANLTYNEMREILKGLSTEGTLSYSWLSYFEWLRGRISQFILDKRNPTVRAFYADKSAAELEPHVVNGFYIGPLMNKDLNPAVFEQTKEHLLSRIKTFNQDKEKDRKKDILVLRSKIAGNKEAEQLFAVTLMQMMKELYPGYESEVDAYLKRVEFVFVSDVGLISPSVVLKKAHYDERSHLRFDFYTALPEEVNMHDPLVQFIIYVLSGDLKVTPVSERLKGALVAALNA
ncbi:MAG: hypothetical protein ACKVQC_04645 [Elusimicrobiota bacterium]